MLIKKIVQFAFFCYYQKIIMEKMEKVPGDSALMFLPNHQNGLLDPLIIAGLSHRKPYFLTRSDVFVNAFFNSIFELLRMVPIYRIRDGRNTVHRNEAIFEKCATLLIEREALVIFPEGNHQIRKIVRPLSKGFTRILKRALDKKPEIEILLIPVGINYQHAERFPDRVKFIFDDPISLQNLIAGKEWNTAIPSIKNRVSSRIQGLTTHVRPEELYEEIMRFLENRNTDFLKPEEVNDTILKYNATIPLGKRKKKNVLHNFTDTLFFILNIPVLLPWKYVIKPRIDEIEFLSTYRFAYALIAFPLYYLALYLMFLSVGTWQATFAVFGIFLHNLLYVKLR